MSQQNAVTQSLITFNFTYQIMVHEIVYSSTPFQRITRREKVINQENVTQSLDDASRFDELTFVDCHAIKKAVNEGKKVLMVCWEADECYSDRTFEIHK